MTIFLKFNILHNRQTPNGLYALNNLHATFDKTNYDKSHINDIHV